MSTIHRPQAHQGPIVRAFVFFMSFLLAANAFAGGFAILEQSSEGVGFGFAGATAGYGDGSSVFFNPGAMSVHESTKITAGAHLIIPEANFTNEGSTINPALGGSPLGGDNGPDGGVLATVPNFYVIQPIDDDLTFGLGVNAPFGLSTEYNRTWVGRYNAVDTDLLTVNIAPALSYEIAPNFSFGAALNVLYADAELSNMVDFGTIGVSTLGAAGAAALGLVPTMSDGLAKVTGDDWGVGYTLGAAYEYCEDSRIGISYRSKVDLTLTGSADFDVPAAAMPLTMGGAFTDTNGTAGLTLPDSLSAGIIHRFNEQWALLGEVQWTHWSRFQELRVEFGNGQPDSVVDENWDNVWRFSIGGEYRPNDRTRLRAGYTFDEEPISDSMHRTPRIPGNDRHWLALGASYDITENLVADLSYAHLFIDDAKTNIASSTGDQLIGSWDLAIDIVSLQFSYIFG